MGSFVFRWPHSANEVFVTGTFDDWGRTVLLEKKGDWFEKEVQLSSADEKIYYKFVVDGSWITDTHAREENDGHNNINNVLLPEDIQTASKPATEFATSAGGNTAAVFMAGVTPDSTTAAIAADVPKESKKDVGAATLSSAAPESSATELAKDVPLENSAAVPGGFPETPAKEPESFSVNPIPASNGISNPIKLNPGEPVPDPSTINANTVESTVTTDKEGYEKDASYPVVPGLGDEAKKPAEAFAVPPVSKNLIPESSLPLNPPATDTTDPGVTIQSAAPTSTTAALAAQVPLESEKTNGAPASEVPDVVKESISQSHQDPEAAANPEAIEEKNEVEHELQKVVEPELAAGEAANTVPGVVKESIEEAQKDPEAAANREAVQEKKAVEQELQKKVPEEESAGEPAPTATAATTETAPAASTDKPVDSTSVSPRTTSPAPAQSQPTVVTGITEAKTTKISEPPITSANTASPDTKEKKKKNRASGFFSKLKEKLR